MEDNNKDNEIQVKGLGWAVKHLYRSNAVSPFITIFLILSSFCLAFAKFLQISWIIYFWATITVVLIALFIVVLIVNSNLLRSEEYNLDLKRLELGEKDKLLSPGDSVEIVQPIKITRQITAKAKILK